MREDATEIGRQADRLGRWRRRSGRTVREGKGVRPKRDGDANVSVADGRPVDSRDKRSIDRGRGNRDHRGAAARAEAGAAVLAVMVGRRAVLMGRVLRVADMIGDLRRRRVVPVLRATVERARVEQRGLKPDGPDGG